MRDQVFMSPNNANLVIGIPLFRRHVMDDCSVGDKIILSIEEEKPVAYALDCGPNVESLQLLSAEWVEKKLVSLGDI